MSKPSDKHRSWAEIPERIRTKIDRSGECWLWTAARNANGYGRTNIGGRPENGGRDRQAHALVYELLIGPIPAGRELDHTCRNRACVNPAHLEPVTHRENLLRGEGFAARYAARTHCGQGHEYTPENTSIRTDGSRRCLTYHRERERHARQAQ